MNVEFANKPELTELCVFVKLTYDARHIWGMRDVILCPSSLIKMLVQDNGSHVRNNTSPLGNRRALLVCFGCKWALVGIEDVFQGLVSLSNI